MSSLPPVTDRVKGLSKPEAPGLRDSCCGQAVAPRSGGWLAARVILLALALALGSLARAADEPAAGRWQSLFNGKDLSGWVPMHGAVFTVTNGNLHLLKGMGWLRTARPYTNFIFEAEWRALVPGYDSGFFLRAGLAGQPWPSGGWQVNLARTALGGLLKGEQTIVPAETPPAPLKQWLKFRMEVNGSRATLDIDGERVWEFNSLDSPSGYLGLQAEDMAFDFRNLRLLELP